MTEPAEQDEQQPADDAGQQPDPVETSTPIPSADYFEKGADRPGQETRQSGGE